MKRGKPLERRTPLQSRASLKAKSQLGRGKPLAPRAPVKAKRSTPRRRSRDTEHGIPWPEVRVVIHARSGGRCEGCGRRLSIDAMEGHHRLTRRLGPDCPCNALALCRSCHHDPDGVAHGSPTAARELGSILSKVAVLVPGEESVEVYGRGRVLLDCAGNYVAIPC